MINNFLVGDYTEELIVDRKGTYFLTIYGRKSQRKKVSEDKAREWYEMRFPRLRWEKVRKEIESNWLKM